MEVKAVEFHSNEQYNIVFLVKYRGLLVCCALQSTKAVTAYL